MPKSGLSKVVHLQSGQSQDQVHDYVLRLLPALSNAMATACLIAFFFVGGWLVPIDPSFFHSSTSVLILLLTTDWLDPFLSGIIFLLFADVRVVPRPGY
ncbi:MAG TPA: hypothetical protein VF296_05330 [Gallionella sp.]